MKRLLSAFLVVASGVTAAAHDPFEITSVAYVHSNRIELFMELELSTALKLAGVEAQPNQTPATLLANAQIPLRTLAGSFFAFTAGNHVVPALQTNVSLNNEEHLQFKLDFAVTAYRPLQFHARGLGIIPDSPYGTTLTVLDMVNQKVLGQTTLFASSPPAQFPTQSVPSTETEPAPEHTAAETGTATSPANSPAPASQPLLPAPLVHASRLSFSMLIGLGFLVCIALAVWRKRP